MKRIALIMLTGLFMSVGSSLASAQAVCGQHEEVTKSLQTGYNESPAGFGLLGNGGLVELFVSEKGTWTFLITRPDGTACLMAAGGNWERLQQASPVADELS